MVLRCLRAQGYQIPTSYSFLHFFISFNFPSIVLNFDRCCFWLSGYVFLLEASQKDDSKLRPWTISEARKFDMTRLGGCYSIDSSLCNLSSIVSFNLDFSF